jgi:hypothetical protein
MIPASASKRPSSMRTSVVLPAPFSPKSANTVPDGTLSVAPSTALNLPNDFETPLTSITVDINHSDCRLSFRNSAVTSCCTSASSSPACSASPSAWLSRAHQQLASLLAALPPCVSCHREARPAHRLDDAFVLKLPVGPRHRVGVDGQLPSQFAHAGDKLRRQRSLRWRRRTSPCRTIWSYTASPLSVSTCRNMESV